jgi:quinoprotein glucose dehydrogenase
VKIWEFSQEHAEFCRELLDGVRFDGIFTPPGESGTLLFPGNGGGTNWGSMAAHPDQGIAVLAVNRMPTIVTLIPREEFAARRDAGGGVMDTEFTAQSGTPYGMARHEVYNPKLMLPCLEGPWGELIALELPTGKVRWRSPLDVFPGLEEHPQAAHWGSLAHGGPIVTSTGLVFIASHYGSRLLAYRLDDGEQLWSADLPARPSATPMSYVIDDTQYVVIAAGGAVPESDTPGDYLVAFSLKREAGAQSR